MTRPFEISSLSVSETKNGFPSVRVMTMSAREAAIIGGHEKVSEISSVMSADCSGYKVSCERLDAAASRSFKVTFKTWFSASSAACCGAPGLTARR